MGLNKYLLEWISSFLADRSFFVHFNKSSSSSHPITCGVPQGSCLSPTLFIAYFSDVTKDIDPEIGQALYADDLCIWSSDRSLKKIEKKLQLAIDKISLFCKLHNIHHCRSSRELHNHLRHQPQNQQPTNSTRTLPHFPGNQTGSQTNF